MSRIKNTCIQVGESMLLCGDVVQKDPRESKMLEDAQRQAAQIVAIARKEAESIICKAKEKKIEVIQKGEEAAKEAYQKGLEEGFAKGYDDGFQKIHQDLENQIKTLDIFAKASNKVRKEIIKSCEREMLYLCLAITEKILKERCENDDKFFLKIIKKTVKELKDKEQIRILVNPVVAHRVFDFTDELKQTIAGLEQVKIIEDKTIPTDGVIVESLDTRVDARLEAQIAEISKRIIKESFNCPCVEILPPDVIEQVNQEVQFLKNGDMA